MNTRFLSAASLAVVSAITLGGLWMSNPVSASNDLLSSPAEEQDFRGAKMLFKELQPQVQKLENGLSITILTEDEEQLAQLHAHADRMLRKQSVTRSVENIANGVVITKTSTLAEVVQELQSDEPRQPRHEAVEVLQENISNGVRVIITSEEAEVVEKLQEHHAEGFEGRRRGRKGNRGGRSGGFGFSRARN